MDRDAHPGTSTGNLLLDAMDADVRVRLMANARTTAIGLGTEFIRVGQEVRSVYFPISGTLSLLAEPDEATTVEASTIGREGAADLFAVLGATRAANRLIGQVEGQAIVIGVEPFRACVAEPGRTQLLVFRYAQALFTQAALSAACNAKHHVDQRAARWLLQTHDRVDGDTFVLKQEFLAYMLGVTRPSVSAAAASLQASQLIGYSRGRITILDRRALEAAACSCYERTRAVYAPLTQP